MDENRFSALQARLTKIEKEKQHILRELRGSWVEAMAKANETGQVNARTKPDDSTVSKQSPNPGSPEGAPPEAAETPPQATEHSSISVQG